MDLTIKGHNMRAFLIEHRGVYLPGFSVMVSENEPTKRQIKSFLNKQLKLKEFSELRIYRVREIDLSQPNNFVVWDGNY